MPQDFSVCGVVANKITGRPTPEQKMAGCGEQPGEILRTGRPTLSAGIRMDSI